MPQSLVRAILASFLVVLAAGFWWAPGLSSQARAGAAANGPARYTALAVRTVGYTASTPIEITLQRWTTDAEHDQLMVELMEGDQKRLLAAMRKLPDIGRLGAAGTVGYPLKYARHMTRADGAEQVTIITPREMSFWEASNMPPSTDYPFWYLDLKLDNKREGEGQMFVATQIAYNRGVKGLIIENYESASLLLQGVRRVN